MDLIAGYAGPNPGESFFRDQRVFLVAKPFKGREICCLKKD